MPLLNDEKVAVLHVGNFLSGSGFTRQLVEDLADQLQASGWPIYRTSALRSRPLRLIDMLWTVWRRRDEFSVAHICVFSGPAFIWAEAAAWVLQAIRKPFVVSLHGGNLPAFSNRSPRRIHRLLRSAASVVTPSRYLQSKMQPFRTDIRVLPNPIDLPKYQFRLRSNAQPQLVWLRAFHAIYNPMLAPPVLAQLAPLFPSITLIMLGPDKGDDSLRATRAQVEALGMTSHIQFPGGVPKSQVPQWLHRGDVFINTTNVDNTPISVIEAMACGLCVVSTNVGGIPDLLEDGVDALLVPPNDPGAMASAVARVVSDPSLAQRLSSNARRKAEQFDWAIVLPQWQQLLMCAAGHFNSGTTC